MDGLRWSELEREQPGWRLPPRGLVVATSLTVIGIVSAGLILLYLLSLHMAARNQETRALDQQIEATRAQAQRLRTEIEIRTRYVELNRWSAPLGLGPAGHGQYVMDGRQLGEAAAERRVALSGDPAKPAAPVAVQAQAQAAPCAGAQAATAACQAGPTATRHGYAPTARAQMDSLVSDILG